MSIENVSLFGGKLSTHPVRAIDWRLVKDIALSFVSCLYIFYAITSLSPDSELKSRIMNPVMGIWNFCGFYQRWSLFSPVIRTINHHTEAIVTFEDGTKMLWQLPRMDRMSLLQRFRLEKIRKWDSDSLPWPDYKQFWPEFARYIGRLYFDPHNKPVQLSLYLFWTKIPTPTKNKIVDRYELPRHTKFTPVFTYFYTPEDFQYCH